MMREPDQEEVSMQTGKLNRGDDYEAASHHLRNAARRAFTISIDGQFTLPVLDAASRAMILALVERIEAIAGIQKGLDDLEAGRVSTLREVLDRPLQADGEGD
jgi:hypothetical protein